MSERLSGDVLVPVAAMAGDVISSPKAAAEMTAITRTLIIGDPRSDERSVDGGTSAGAERRCRAP